MTHYVVIRGKKTLVQVTVKNMKKVRLKVFPDGTIKLSVPEGTPDSWIMEFLSEKKGWIEGKIDLFQETKAIEKEEHIRSGSSTRILGKQMVIQVEKSNQKKIVCEDNKLLIYTTDPAIQLDIDKQFNNWWQKNARSYFSDILCKLFPIIGRHGVEQPELVVKKMKTLWGSCSRKHRKINLNFYLFKASRPCIEYVILHELTHFLYPKHNRDFQDFITIYMPDWDDRRKLLDYEIVLGV